MRSPPARRRSSLVPPPTAKPGTYRARTIAFAPNITPDSFDQPPSDVDDIEDGDNEFSLFPPSQEPVVPAKRRHKKRPADHVPRPPNAFMLFRADFVRQKHVPGSIETNHTSLSKIIGSLWRSLPPSEKRVWEHRAKQEKVQHQRKYPDYKYKPVHNRTKAKSVKKEERIENDEERCEEIAQLLLDGNKGAGLAEAVRRLDRKRRGSDSGVVASNSSAGEDTWMRRRSSSVPPELNQASLYLPRRPSSSSGAFPSSSSLPHSYYPPEYPPPYPSHHHHHLPSVNTALFNPEYLQDSNPFSHSAPPPSFSNPFSYESTSPYDMPPSFSSADVSAAPSPAPSSEGSLPPLYAPQPQHPIGSMDAVLPFLSASQRMSISEGRFSFSDLTAEQRSGLRQSFGWSENIDMTQLHHDYTQPHQEQYTRAENGYTEFSYEGRRFSISEMDFAALMEHAGNPLHAHLVQGDGSSDSGDTLGGNHNRDLCIAPHDTVMGNDMAADY